MSKKVYLPLKEFNYKYNLSPKVIEQKLCDKSLNENSYIRKGCHPYIDETFFVRRLEFKRKIWLEAHELYYFLNKFWNDSEISFILAKYDKNIDEKNIHNWNAFLAKGLFYMTEDSILKYKISSKFWNFYRYAKMIFHRLHRYKYIPRNKRSLDLFLS